MKPTSAPAVNPESRATASAPLPTALKLRLLVGYLGERAQFAWWPTAFCEVSSRPFLEPIFPKTSSLARYQGVVEAARRVHDEHLNVGSYHLFRLPEETEQVLHDHARRTDAADYAAHCTSSKDAALSYLKELASSISIQGVGPTAIGKISDLNAPATNKAIAAAYLSAFSQGARTYPYLASSV